MVRTTATSRTASTETERLRELEARARARVAAEWARAEFSIEKFVELTSPHLEKVPHLGPLDEILDLSMRKPVIALVEAPPRHGKTFRIEHHCARRLKYRPKEQVAYASYAAQFANRRSRNVRKIAARAGIWAVEAASSRRGSKFEDPASAVSYWQTQAGGAFVAGGRGGSFVGEGFGFIAIDDPFKNRDEAESPLISDKVFESLFQGTLFTRLEPGGSLLITHQPWNMDDLIERVKDLLRKEAIPHEVITLRAVEQAKYDDKGRLKSGKALWPKRYPISRLRTIQGAVGAYNWESQYQCNRVPKGKRIFREPNTFQAPKKDGIVCALSVDPGIVENLKKDPSSYVVGYGYLDAERNVCIDVVHAEEQHEEIPETVDRLELLASAWHPSKIILEEVSAFRSISQVARRLDQERVKRGQSPANLPIYSWVPEGSKFVRSIPTAGAVGFGRVRFWLGKEWVPAVNLQLTRFTGREGGKDGFVDALVQMYDYFERTLVLSSVRARSGGPRATADSPW